MAKSPVIAIIPARRNSKSIPGKNHRVLAGRPLVAWVIAAATAAERVERVIVATDDPSVSEIALGLGAEVHNRSPGTATDTAPTEAVLAEVLDAVHAEHYALLQATSPLTTASDVDGAIDLYFSTPYDSVLSVAPQARFVWVLRDGEGVPWNYDPQKRPRRQDCDPILVENGAIYVSSAEILRQKGSRLGGRVGLFRMAPETYCEVDEPSDWDIMAQLLVHRQEKQADWSRIKLVLSDVDGVLTDNGMYWSSDGAESKKFSARDGKGFELLHTRGIKTALVTSEATELVARRGTKLGCYVVELACRDKVATAERIRVELSLDWEEIAFIGDDLHDLSLLGRVGASFAPSDAVTTVREAVDYVLSSSGGEGCFRELADLLLAGRETARI